MKRSLLRNSLGAAAALGGLALAPGAHAQTPPDCSTLPSPVYVAGSTAVKPFLKLVAANLAALGAPITIVYQGAGSCTGVGFLSTTPSGSITGTASYWTTAAVETTCNLDLAGNAVDVGVSDVFASTCTSTALPADVKDFWGPVQSMVFGVPKTSVNTSISAEAAYLVYGFGSAGLVPNYTDDTLIFQRNASSGTQNMIARAINVPAAKWQGVATATGGAMITNLTAAATAGNQDKAIGILSSDIIAANTSTLKALAYQHYGQSCGYLPDVTGLDKANVRDGHYMIWGPLHMLAHTTAGVIQSASVKSVVDILSGAAAAGFDLIDAEAKGGVVPNCAMAVSRTTEDGPMSSNGTRVEICDCKFDASATGAAPTGCTTCANDAACTGTTRNGLSTTHCRYGYCEAL